jgi:hypothetical protein
MRRAINGWFLVIFAAGLNQQIVHGFIKTLTTAW